MNGLLSPGAVQSFELIKTVCEQLKPPILTLPPPLSVDVAARAGHQPQSRPVNLISVCHDRHTSGESTVADQPLIM